MGPTESRFKRQAALWPEHAQPWAVGAECRNTPLQAGVRAGGLETLFVSTLSRVAGVLGSGSIFSVGSRKLPLRVEAHSLLRPPFPVP